MKPILFNTDDVRALLDGRKSCTRRVVKPQPTLNGRFWELGGAGWADTISTIEPVPGHSLYNRAPYQPGDVLYVREAWQEVFETEVDKNAPRNCVNIREIILNFDTIPKTEAELSQEWACASMEPRMKYYVYKASDIEYADLKNGLRWRPSIHMPKEAARIFLRVTDIRVERLQDITEEQARAGGAKPFAVSVDPEDTPNNERTWVEMGPALPHFISLWDTTIKPADRDKYGWDANPWVWVIGFERISMEEAVKSET